MKAKKKLTISFAEEYEELYNFLKDKKDRSCFVCNILNNYLKGDCSEEEKIERAVTRALSKYDFSINNKQENIEEKNGENVTQADKDLIKNLF
ncbi:hypothetical protein ONV75_16475 [Clostridium sp. LQ25]|uniref:hypothetical protein n=1 Tax=Clostridium sp. LQ25 TaxID=2992805 RepID=UPI002252FAF3|nr:hypothetical protein [Clostridium sp. LQ25]UZT06176.1 hypothetical protein ONV75_16475 [Clostridium sp. LQ25]